MREPLVAHTGTDDDSALEEALARCEFLVTRRRPLGVVCGPAGCGQSRVLEALEIQFRNRHDTLTVTMDATASNAPQFLAELASALDIGSAGQAGESLETALRDRLAGLADCGRGLLVCLRRLDEADPSTIRFLARLLRQTALQPALTVIASIEAPPAPPLRSLLEEFGFVRIELAAWNSREIRAAVGRRLPDTDGNVPLVAADVVNTIQAATRGLPRDVERLCDLLELARTQGDALELTPESIRAAAAELCSLQP